VDRQVSDSEPIYPDWVGAFLSALYGSPNVAAAARKAGICRQYAYELRAKDETFRRLWDDAIEDAVDDLVGDCFARAKGASGSDYLAAFLLKAHRASVYGERSRVTAEISGPGGGPVPIEVDVSKLSDDQLRAIVAGQGGGRA
jgi:hypothetical protein